MGGSQADNEDSSIYTDSASVTDSTGSAPSIFSAPAALAPELQDEDMEPVTPPRSPHATIRQGKRAETRSLDPYRTSPGKEELQSPRRPLAGVFDATTPRRGHSGDQAGGDQEHGLKPNNHYMQSDLDATPRASVILPEKADTAHVQLQSRHSSDRRDKNSEAGPSTAGHNAPLPNFMQFVTDPGNGGTILEQAWMMKMAGEIARRYQEEREKGNLGRDTEAPPAYVG